MVMEHLVELAYLSVVVSSVASWLQTVGQQHVPPHEAVIIYTLDPVYGALFAWLLLGEEIHALGWLGIVLVVAANLLRKLPWHTWEVTKTLVTPTPSEMALNQLDSKRTPLLGTPQTPSWLQAWVRWHLPSTRGGGGG